MGQKIISAIDIRADKVICLIAQELQILDKGKILQLIGIGTSKLKVNCLKPFSLETDEIKNHLDAAISKAEVDAGIKISNVYVSISENMKSDYIEFENKISGRIITENDIKSFFEDTWGSYANASKLRSEGWRPQYELKKGAKKTIYEIKKKII